MSYSSWGTINQLNVAEMGRRTLGKTGVSTTVYVNLIEYPEYGFGFDLTADDPNLPAHLAMLSLLRDAYKDSLQVVIWWDEISGTKYGFIRDVQYGPIQITVPAGTDQKVPIGPLPDKTEDQSKKPKFSGYVRERKKVSGWEVQLAQADVGADTMFVQVGSDVSREGVKIVKEAMDSVNWKVEMNEENGMMNMKAISSVGMSESAVEKVVQVMAQVDSGRTVQISNLNVTPDKSEKKLGAIPSSAFNQ